MSRLMVMAGGTGGHVYPALAVADLLRAAGVDVVWLGTRQGLEARVVPDAGFTMEWINIRGLRGNGGLGWLVSPFLIARAALQAFRVMRRTRPDALLGMGGFVSGPGGLVAFLTRRPLLIHEQNAVAGMTNRLLAPLAKRVFTGFPDTLPGAEFVGNPVREEFESVGLKRKAAIGERRLRLLVVGGSQGAKVLNDLMPLVFAALNDNERPHVRHQTGRGRAQGVRAAYEGVSGDIQIDEFIDNMADAYAWADLVLCRAGAMTVAEVAAAGVAAIFVPLPHAAGNHQSANARYLSKHDAAMMIPESALSVNALAEVICGFVRDPETAIQMGVRAMQFAERDASASIARACQEVINA